MNFTLRSNTFFFSVTAVVMKVMKHKGVKERLQLLYLYFQQEGHRGGFGVAPWQFPVSMGLLISPERTRSGLNWGGSKPVVFFSIFDEAAEVDGQTNLVQPTSANRT